MALTENGIFLANNVVENFIKESGGADHLMQKMRGKTYALDFIVSVVEGTYASILEDVDSENPESFESSDEKKEEMFDDILYYHSLPITFLFFSSVFQGIHLQIHFFNCYGPSLTFNIGDKQKTPINHVDIEMKFRAKLRIIM